MTTPPPDPFGAPGGEGPGYGAPYPGYGAPFPGYAPGRPGTPPRNGLGTAALVLGIVSLFAAVTVVLGLVLGLLAVVFGVIGRGRVRRAEATNGGAALTGIITGALAVALSAGILALGISIFTGSSGRSYRSCLQGAGTQAQVQACAQQFQHSFTGH